MLILVFLVGVPIILICLIQKSRELPPGPPALPLIGNLHQLATAKIPHVYLWQLSKKYGPIFSLKLGSVPVVVISSAKLSKQVLKTQDLVFCSRPYHVGQQKLSYQGKDMVFSPYNSYWREVRKIIGLQLFSIKKVQSLGPIREEEVSRLVAKLSCNSDKVVNLSEVAMAYASTMICRSAFGKRYDESGSEIRRFDDLLCQTQAMAAAFFLSDYIPMLGWVDRLSGFISWADATCKRLDSFYQELIDDHLHPNRDKKEEDEDDILDVLIKIKQDKSDFTWDHVKALLMNIFVAGTDTGAASIVWIMTVLMKSDNTMEKLQQHMRSVIGAKGKVEEDDLPKLPYLKAVINEIFRLYPPVPMLIPRESMERTTLDGYDIPPRTVVYVNAWAVARDPDYWENPDEFLPERFLNTTRDIRGQDFGVIPFGSGRRICPGVHMGLLNIELTIANLVYTFDWELPPGVGKEDVDTDILPGITVHKKNPLLLVPKKFVM